MDSVFYKRGNIRGLVAVIKSLASALSIGTGAAVGREGPIIQIGSALGSAFSQWLGLATSQKITLLAAGAGAGIAATFNTPLGGVLFALEIILPEVSNRTFLPVVIATGAATLLGRLLIGPAPAFAVPTIVMPPTLHFGLEQGVAYRRAGSLVRRRRLGLHSTSGADGGRVSEDTGRCLRSEHHRHGADRRNDGRARRTPSAITTSMASATASSRPMLDKRMAVPGLLALLFCLKLLATTICLGCGASGGIFSPSLYLGATLGASFALLIGAFAPRVGLEAPAAAIVGMAAMVGAGTGGVMTAIVMVFEMTREYADHRAGHRRRRSGRRRAPRADLRNDLHHQAAPSRAPNTEGAARQSLSRQQASE